MAKKTMRFARLTLRKQYQQQGPEALAAFAANVAAEMNSQHPDKKTSWSARLDEYNPSSGIMNCTVTGIRGKTKKQIIFSIADHSDSPAEIAEAGLYNFFYTKTGQYNEWINQPANRQWLAKGK